MQRSILGKLMAAQAARETEQTQEQRPAAQAQAEHSERLAAQLQDQNSKFKIQNSKLSSYPPPDKWDEWTEYDPKAWPRKVPRRYTLVPTVCFNCESACGLLSGSPSW